MQVQEMYDDCVAAITEGAFDHLDAVPVVQRATVHWQLTKG